MTQLIEQLEAVRYSHLTATCWQMQRKRQCERCLATITKNIKYTLACKVNTLAAWIVWFHVIELALLTRPTIFDFSYMFKLDYHKSPLRLIETAVFFYDYLCVS
jgi:hypothetical protein